MCLNSSISLQGIAKILTFYFFILYILEIYNLHMLLQSLSQKKSCVVAEQRKENVHSEIK